MATIGVLTYTFPPGLKLKNTSFNKITFGGISESNGINNNNNNNNTIITKIPDVGMIGSEVLVMRKKQKLVPLLNSNAKNIQQQPPAKKIKLSENIVNNNSATTKLGVPPTSGKKTTPLPQAVARRNARERNRVKQVNNGFAALRQHIPEEIAEAFEAAGNGRGTAKKLSKVETLRMAVEYIRSLERLLELDVTKSNFNEGETSPTKTVIKTEINNTTALDEQYAESNYDSEENVTYMNDTLPDITTVNGQQYIRIPGTNTYQLITTEIFENEENIQPIAGNNFTDIALGTHLGSYTLTTNSEDVSPTMAPASLSTDRYSSENQPSLSPAVHLQQNHQHLLSQLQMHQEQHVHIKCEDTAIIYQSQLAPSSPPISEGQGFADIQLYDHGISSSTLKREIKQEIILETAALSEESMMEAIDWWDAHTPQSDDSVIL